MEEDVLTQEDVAAARLERLLHAMASGDTGALAEFYGLTRNAVYALALSMLGSAHDAEELCQDAFLRIWDNAGRYRASGTPMAWVMTLTRNLCLMELRRRSRTAGLTAEEWDAIPASSQDVSADDRQLLQTALGNLDAVDRQIVLLHAVAGLKHRESAKLLGLPLNTVLSKYRRALDKMRKYMKGE